MSVDRPRFTAALARWHHLLGEGRNVSWVFRENLRLGTSLDESLTIAFQRFAPRVDAEQAARVYERVEPTAALLRFELLVDAPGACIGTLRTDQGHVEQVTHVREWGLWFQLAPSYHTFVEIETAEQWDRLEHDARNEERELGSVLPLGSAG